MDNKVNSINGQITFEGKFADFLPLSQYNNTYTRPVATQIKKKPRKIRRHVSCFLSNGCDRPPQAPAHRQQHTHNLIQQKTANRKLKLVWLDSIDFHLSSICCYFCYWKLCIAKSKVQNNCAYPTIGIKTMINAATNITSKIAQ